MQLDCLIIMSIVREKLDYVACVDLNVVAVKSKLVPCVCVFPCFPPLHTPPLSMQIHHFDAKWSSFTDVVYFSYVGVFCIALRLGSKMVIRHRNCSLVILQRRKVSLSCFSLLIPVHRASIEQCRVFPRRTRYLNICTCHIKSKLSFLKTDQ